jgi:hypothetical protein
MDKRLEKGFRERAVELGNSGDPSALPELIGLTQSPVANVRRLAASAIGKLGAYTNGRRRTAGKDGGSRRSLPSPPVHSRWTYRDLLRRANQATTRRLAHFAARYECLDASQVAKFPERVAAPLRYREHYGARFHLFYASKDAGSALCQVVAYEIQRSHSVLRTSGAADGANKPAARGARTCASQHGGDSPPGVFRTGRDRPNPIAVS